VQTKEFSELADAGDPGLRMMEEFTRNHLHLSMAS
jgi:hypothetical protein